MWSDLRADAVLREINALSGAGLVVDEVHSAALAAMGRVLPFDAACMGAVDPDTLLLTSGVTIGFSPSVGESERFVELEYGGVERYSFANLIDRGVPVLADAGGLPARQRMDVRYHEMVKLLGFAHDVRITFVSDDNCWAVGDLYRADATDEFEARELQFLDRAARLVAAATRSAIRRTDVDTGVLPDGAAVLVVERDGSVSGMTAGARGWIDDPADDGAPSTMWWAIRTAVATARRGVPTAYTRVRLGARWVVVRASALGSTPRDAPVAVTIDEAGVRELADLYMAAHGLTRREREICHEVIAGRSTKEIADRLFISVHTVQDHLKSVFDKAGVRSRRELVAMLGS
ncbi:MAG: helix-turn-helix transcriptional regulator [Actinobacteria bacterium]|nr:helix-turn-helix transcriptional regulator [Actinomycetota bacterium]